MATIRGIAACERAARAVCVIGTALLVLTACDKLAGDDTAFARAALERNEQLSIVAFDKNAKTFTVKVRDTGEIQVVRADQIIATLPGAEAPAAAKPTAATAPVAASGAEAVADTVAPAGEPARPAPGSELPPVPEQAGIGSGGVAHGTGVITNSRGKVFETGSTGPGAAAANTADTSASDSSAAVPESHDRKTLAAGPGYSIKAGDGSPPPSAIRLASSSAEIPSPARGVALERRYEPMICQGQQLLHIDGRNLEFEGDAISAESGCEIHITNSHIIAHGLGVSARAANVHIKNSVIEGDSGSVSAADGAQVYTQSSTFKGLSRRLDTASFHDLGGTVWN
jgi:hypothetical protein